MILVKIFSTLSATLSLFATPSLFADGGVVLFELFIFVDGGVILFSFCCVFSSVFTTV